jgi:serine O-acetyltransferase
MHRRTMVKYGIEIPYTTRIGPGLYIGHFGGIVVSSEASLGRNVNLSQGVTIGARFRGGRIDAPVIGDRVYIGPGAKIVGACRIADGCVIGPNAVVVGDQDENAVVVGIPGRAIKFTGSAEYCVNDV